MLIRVKGKARRFVRRPAGTPYPHRRVQTAAEDGQGQHNETETTESNNTGSHEGKPRDGGGRGWVKQAAAPNWSQVRPTPTGNVSSREAYQLPRRTRCHISCAEQP